MALLLRRRIALDGNHYRDIIDLMKDGQKGLTIEEISKKTGLSRITTAKYLNSLFVSGQVDMRKTGPAKVFTLSKRLPVDQILSESSDLILILDESAVIRDISDSFSLMFGIGTELLKNKSITTTSIGADLFDRIRDPVRKGMSGTKCVVNAWIPVRKEWKAFQIRIIPLVFGWGDKGVLIEFEDRTDGIMAEEENALLADLVDASPAAIVVYDFEGKVLYSNKKNLDLLGYSLAEFLELDSSRIDIGGSADSIAEWIKEIGKGDVATYEVLYCHKDGRQIPLEVHAKVARWGDQEVIITIATDISERKKAERVLMDSNQRFADIINFLPDPTFVVDSEGKVIAWNCAIEEMTGVKTSDMVGKTNYECSVAIYGKHRPLLVDLIFHDDPEVRKLYRHLHKEDCTFTAETQLDRQDRKERILWLKASPFYDQTRQITGAIESIRDITDWRPHSRRKKTCRDAGAARGPAYWSFGLGSGSNSGREVTG